MKKNMDLASFLIIPEENETTVDKTLAPTPENLRAALSKASVPTKPHLHDASGINFKLKAMSSEGYTALNNVTKMNPMTGYPQSTPSEDEFERNVIYLMHGVAVPAISREEAIAILRRPGWGPSNVSLLDHIKEINPVAEEKGNSFIMLMQACRFFSLFTNILSQTGAIDELAKKYNLTDDLIVSLHYCINSFNLILRTDYAGKAWGIPLELEEMVNKLPITPPVTEEEVKEEVAAEVEEDDVVEKPKRKKAE